MGFINGRFSPERYGAAFLQGLSRNDYFGNSSIHEVMCICLQINLGEKKQNKGCSVSAWYASRKEQMQERMATCSKACTTALGMEYFKEYHTLKYCLKD